MNIATYNLHKGGRGAQHWSRMIEDHAVDLLFVQESFSPERHLPPLLHPDVAQQTVWQAVSPNSWGSGIYTSQGTLTTVLVPDFAGCVVGAELAGAPWQTNGPTLLFSIHAPASPGSYQQAVNEILDRIETLAGDRELIIGGDFNLTISKRHSTEARRLKAADAAIQNRLKEQFGLINCWEQANPDMPLAQTLRWTGNRETAYHCDGLFVLRSWQERIRTCRVLTGEEWDQMSDHNPVLATFGE